MRRTRLWIVAAACGLVALLAAGCGGSNSTSTSSSSPITVGSDIPYPPFEFGSTPPYKGFDIDLVNAVAKKLGRTATYQNTSFDTIFRDLAQGKFDMVASSTTITKERLGEVDFSEPYFDADQSLMVKKGSSIKTVADVSGATVGAQTGTTGAKYAQDKTNASSVRTYSKIDDAFNALEAGQVDAVINDFPVSAYATKSHTDLEVVQTLPTGEKYGFAFPKGSPLESDFNTALTGLKQDGTYTKIFKKWFGQDPPASILKDNAIPKASDPGIPAS
ncbi:MAG: polar amino acid transport system substrate-binding protein [Solirubrobacterales bacterium]|jgi:ABC-type amino acid transport substrate-binding protein|nr:polar amino acid transport system substrate-binding protein [Solirubrobacterales bacterium]